MYFRINENLTLYHTVKKLEKEKQILESHLFSHLQRFSIWTGLKV